MGGMSPGTWVHCGRVFSAADLAGIRQTVAWLPRLGRRELAATRCEHSKKCRHRLTVLLLYGLC